MKFRHDFVTNSSSSSFIIGKKDDESATIESVYQLIRNLYKTQLENRNRLIEWIKEYPDLNLEYKEDDEGWCYFRFKKGHSWDPENKETAKMIKKEFNISSFDSFRKDQEWLNCESYEEYEKYWMEKMEKAKSWTVHAPFTIADFLEEKEINWLHYSSTYDDDKVHKVDIHSDVLGWYYPYIEEAFMYPENCDECHYNNYCDKEECLEQQQNIKYKDIPADKACLYLLGRVCIHSECGYIPDTIVDELTEISEYSCNHMG